MNRLGEAVRGFLMRERTLQRFEKELREGETFSYDVFLKRGTLYVVRGGVSKGRAFAKVSLTESNGTTIPINTDKGGMYFSVVPEKDGLYQIRTAVEGTVKKGSPVTIRVALCSAFPIPSYITVQSVVPAKVTERLENASVAPVESEVTAAYGQTQAG
jgi:hypothetical protein